MTLQKVDKGGVEGWRWGDDGTIFTGTDAKRKALREGADLDPRVFAQLESRYGVVMAGEDISWDIPDNDEIIHLD
jgi:hypothetical protein